MATIEWTDGLGRFVGGQYAWVDHITGEIRRGGPILDVTVHGNQLFIPSEWEVGAEGLPMGKKLFPTCVPSFWVNCFMENVSGSFYESGDLEDIRVHAYDIHGPLTFREQARNMTVTLFPPGDASTLDKSLIHPHESVRFLRWILCGLLRRGGDIDLPEVEEPKDLQVINPTRVSTALEIEAVIRTVQSIFLNLPESLEQWTWEGKYSTTLPGGYPVTWDANLSHTASHGFRTALVWEFLKAGRQSGLKPTSVIYDNPSKPQVTVSWAHLVREALERGVHPPTGSLHHMNSRPGINPPPV